MSRISNVHIDQALTNFALQLEVEQGMLQDMVSPIVGVKKESDKYWVFGREELKTHPTHIADGAEAHEIEHEYSTATYSCDEWGLKEFITQRQMDNADNPLDPQMDGVQKCVLNTRLARERRIAAVVQSTSTWDGSATPSTKWNAASGDPESDVRAAKQAFLLQSGSYPNVAVISDVVYDVLIDWLRGKPGGITLAEYKATMQHEKFSGVASRLSGLFNIDTWLVGRQLYDSAALGATASLARVWGNHCTLLYVNPRPALRSRSALYTFQKRGFVVTKYDVAGRNGFYVEARRLHDEKTVSSALGYHIYTVLS